MSVYKDGNKWRVLYRYTDITGERRQTQKRGFDTRREALAWESEMRLRLGVNLNMMFETFWEIYKNDKIPRVRESTWSVRESAVKKWILPYFGKRKLNEIEAKDIIAWQTELMNQHGQYAKPLSPDYLRTLHSYLAAIFNHAERYYKLPFNPTKHVPVMGKEKPKEMSFWTRDEYTRFAQGLEINSPYYYAFEILYWTGVRCGEMLALTADDFDFEEKTLRINKTYYRLKGKDVISDPKTPKSKRVIVLPDFLCEEMRRYIASLYEVSPKDRIFNFSKISLTRVMDRTCEETGVKRIRIHDIRHSHVSLLIDQGFSALAIGNRVGHESERITYRYAHLFPTVQTEMANRLDSLKGTAAKTG